MNSVREFETHSGEETQAVGREIAALLPRQAVVLLIGDLGAGKTTLTKGIVEGRGAAPADEVSSPTFTLIHEYGEPVSIYHADLYRLETAEQVRRLGLEELFDRPALLLVEWGERFPELFPEVRFEIRLTDAGEDNRRIVIESSEQSGDDFYLTANLFPKRTGLPFVIWVSNRGAAKHDVRVKVAPGPRAQSTDLVSVAIRPTIHVVGENPFNSSDFDLLRQWIELNYDAILLYWNEEIDTGDLMDALRPLGGIHGRES